MKRVVILHQAVDAASRPDELDVLVQVDCVASSLNRLGYAPVVVPCGLNLEHLHHALTEFRPDLLFNLVESLAGTDALQFVVPAVVEALAVPMTGSSSSSIFLSGRKVPAKERLVAAGLPTPRWIVDSDPSRSPPVALEVETFQPTRYIIKPVAEHASLGMEDGDVVFATSPAELQRRIRAKSEQLGRTCFAEEFIDGREFNLSLLAGPAGPEVLPAAEIRFEGFAPEKPRIVGTAAKWDEQSFEYHATVRSFDFPAEDSPLLVRLRDLAVGCWRAFGLSGYARVDFRVDDAGQPWILEANANPCLSPDAGFAAAAARAGISFDQIVDRIVRAA